MRIHTILTHLTLFASITTTISAYAGDWQISRIGHNNNMVYLISNDSIKDTGIGSKSAKIVAINRDQTRKIEYRQDDTGLTKPKIVDMYGNVALTATSPWDLASYSIEVDCDTNQYRYIELIRYYYNNELIKSDGYIADWKSSREEDSGIIYDFGITSDSDISEHANVICKRPTKYKSIKNLKSNADNLDWRELVSLGRDILNNTSNYYINKTNKPNKLNKKFKINP